LRRALRRFPPPRRDQGEAGGIVNDDRAVARSRATSRAFLHICRYEATANRRASLRGIPTKKGYDRDEYPPAMADEGGKGASVRYILSSENRSAGGVMSHQLAPYCNEQRFIFERWRNR
jgi:hypothetical protein